MIMKNQMLSKRVLGLYIFGLLLVSLSLFPSFSVKAEDNKRKCSGELTGEALKRYGIGMSVSGNNAVIKMNAQSANAKKAEFKVTKVNGTAYTENKVLKNGKSIQVPTSYVKNGNINEMEIVLQATDEKIDEEFCEGEGNITIKLVFTKGGEPRIERGVVKVDYDDIKPATSKSIDCTGYGTFTDEKKLNSNTVRDWFCRAKNNVKKENSYVFKAKDMTDSKRVTYIDGENVGPFKCSYKDTLTEDDIARDGYYRENNRTYLYGVGTYTLNFGNYKYHLSPGDSAVNGKKVSCDVTCEEAVTVEYGPPVASKAGLCFEYKVRVTSVVNCYMSKKPEQPEDKYNYCTPTPFCTNASGSYLVHQGGPNETFDSCIKDCDNGKYTEKCSKKCYNQVYGTSGNTNMGSGLQEAAIEKIKSAVNKTPPKSSNTFTGNKITTNASFSFNDCKAWNNSTGCYVRSGGSITWQGSGPGRWYGGSCPSGYAVFEGNGICRHDYGNNDHCHDICWWSGCDGQYINPVFPQKDYENNKEIYKQAVNQCSAAASCTTTTAEFTIKVDYTKGNGTSSELVFPYEKEPDKITSGPDKTFNTSKDNHSTILGYAGCYGENDGENRYQTEWSFPGTWINNKTGEITYEPIGGEAWKEQKDKFCIPMDAKDVNQEWWNYYYNKVFGSNPKYSVNSSEYQEECGKSNITKRNTLTKEQIDGIKYNIKAYAKKFGYFHWNIDVRCFYALNSQKVGKSKDSNDEKCTPNDDPKTSNYRVRSVDLNNLFPATDGSKLATTASVGRAPGFNWTKFSDTTDTNKSGTGYNKNSIYKVEPEKYITKVQSTGYSVYSDAYLDYEFNLTPDVLNDLRNSTKSDDFNYTNFTGKVISPNASNASYYRSDVIRSIANAKYPKNESALKCNNMKNYQSGECDNYTS